MGIKTLSLPMTLKPRRLPLVIKKFDYSPTYGTGPGKNAKGNSMEDLLVV